MRCFVVCAAIAIGCGGSERMAALEQRTTMLEARPLPEPDPRVHRLEKRVEELEVLVEQLQERLQRLVDVAAAQPAPVPAPSPSPSPPSRPQLDRGRVHAIPLGDSPAFGSRTAPVTMVLAVQFPEPYTQKAWPTIDTLRTEYKQQLRIVLKSYIVHSQAADATIAACAAARQRALDDMVKLIWDVSAPPDVGRRWPDAAELRDLAKQLRLDLRQYDRDVAACQTARTRDQAMFTKLGQRAVPVFWINGRPLEGAMPIEHFRTIIDEELAKAKADRARGGKPATYYDRLMRTAVQGP